METFFAHFEPDPVKYKAAKEAWVTGHTGSPITEIILVTLTSVSAFWLWKCRDAHYRLVNRTVLNVTASIGIGNRDARTSVFGLFEEFFLLIVPLILACTRTEYTVSLLLVQIVAGLYHFMQLPSSPKLKVHDKWRKSPAEQLYDLETTSLLAKRGSSTSNDVIVTRRSFLSYYRASMMILTCIAILAVDFPVFPRKFAKVETYGISLMDLGVGSFIFSSGIVSAKGTVLYYLRMSNNGRPSNGWSFKHTFGQFMRHTVQSLKATLPLLVLGLGRLYSVKKSGYQEHVTEYGTHWNFFFTLASLPLFTPLVLFIFAGSPILASSVIGILYQIGLSFGGWEDFIQNAPRTDLLSHNKEGIFSMLGYLSIYFCGMALGQAVLPRPESWEDRRDQPIELLGMSMMAWLAFVVVRYVCGVEISRQMANLSYVVFVVAFNLVQLMVLVWIESDVDNIGTVLADGEKEVDDLDAEIKPKRKNTATKSSAVATSGDTGLRMRKAGKDSPSKDTDESKQQEGEQKKQEAVGFITPINAEPYIFSAVNFNGLTVFLFANILTGLINFSIQTLYATDLASYSVIVSYILVVLLVAVLLYSRRVHIK
ncbi:hypothetical protein GQ42DRAFT_160481 [Ramicandelaber brevisporus]|nr:hypothetical protein GQ42DRAFT_160481 [Ramicandelaber brevisporus]